MQDWGKLLVSQGDEESLIIETDEDVLEKTSTRVRDGTLVLRVGRGILERLELGLQTSLTRPSLRYSLTVKAQEGLVVAGLCRVMVDSLESTQLHVSLSGGGSISRQSVTVERLEAELSGAGQIEVAGQATDQQVSLDGAGRYAGGRLETAQTRVTISGAGSAIVWASEELEVGPSGVGSGEYYGAPATRESVSGVGTVKRLGDRPSR